MKGLVMGVIPHRRGNKLLFKTPQMQTITWKNRLKGIPNISFLALCIFIPAIVPAIAGPEASGRKSVGANGLDSALVRKFYMDGEFEPAIATLESELASKGILSHDDSVFIFKHLGVMYAAQYETRERGKMYMHKLLMAEPTAKIMDMYASDMIYMIFKNIQDEFVTNRTRLARSKEHVDQNSQNPQDSATASMHRTSGSKSGMRTGIWIGAAAVAVGIGTYFLISNLSSGGGGENHSF